MRPASEARKITENVLTTVESSPEYKSAMKRIEEEIELATSQGKSSFRYNICALSHGKNGPSHAVLKAVKKECAKNGYSFVLSHSFNRIGQCNPWFEVSW